MFENALRCKYTSSNGDIVYQGSSQPEPPPGYTFIPAGDPQITSRCKHFARVDGAKVFEVSVCDPRVPQVILHQLKRTQAKRKRFNGGIADQMHRIGYHFPSSIVARACTSLGIDLTRDGRVLHNQRNWEVTARPKPRSRKWQKLLAENASKPGLSQAAIDTQAREAIKDLFPKIPQKDLHDIVTHAFELVGYIPCVNCGADILLGYTTRRSRRRSQAFPPKASPACSSCSYSAQLHAIR